jgi:cytosine permease
VFLVGAQLGQSLGLYNAIIAFFAAGIVLASIAAAVGIVAAKTRLTTWMIIQFAFGHTGAKFVSAVVGITVLGWYGATVDMFAQAVDLIVQDLGGPAIDSRIYLVVASTLMVAIALFGFKGLDRLSRLAVPVMIALLASLIYTAISSFGIPVNSTGEMSLPAGISAGIGGFIVAVVMFPDICRYARSPGDAVAASSVSFGLGVPVVMLLAAIPVLLTGEPDFLKVMLLVGLGLVGLILLLFATWTTNAYNLYSTSLVFASIIESVAKWKLVVVAGVLGTGIAMLPILENFLSFLHILAVLIPPIAGIYLADFFIICKQQYDTESMAQLDAIRPLAFVAWFVGAFAGYTTGAGHMTLTTVPAIDAIAISFVFYIVSRLILDRQ